MRYEWQSGTNLGVPVEVAAQEITRITTRDGGATPKVIVDEARPEEAPLHPAFEWDDSKAGELFRLGQARNLVRAIVLAPEPEKNETQSPVRAFISVSHPKPSRIYKPTLEVLREPDEAEEVKRRFRHELLALRQRYMALLELDEALNQKVSELLAG